MEKINIDKPDFQFPAKTFCFHSPNIQSVKDQLDIFKLNFDSFHLCVCGQLCKKVYFLFEFDEVWS